MMNPDPREAKLAKWAQQTLTRLRRRIDELEDRLQEVEPGPEIRVVSDPWAEVPRPVGDVRTSVRFDLGAYRWLDVRIDGDDDGAVLIHASEGVRIEPQASNSFRVIPNRSF